MEQNTSTLATRLSAVQRELEALIRSLADTVTELPDNPRIRRVSGNPAVFILRAKDLGSSWSPEYHDFKVQYKAIHDKLFGHPLDVFEWWSTVRTAGKLKLSDDYVLSLHPDVIKHVNKLLEVV